MPIDPISFFLTLWVVGMLLKRVPQYAQELADALRNGSLANAYREQMRRLARAGLSPSWRGPRWWRMGANAWRQAWADRAAAADRAARRAEANGGRGWWGRWADRGTARRTDRYRPPVRATATVGRPQPAAASTAGDGRAALTAGDGGGPTPPPPTPTPPPSPRPGPIYTAAYVGATTATASSDQAIPAANGNGRVTATIDRPTPAALSAPAAAAALPAGAAAALTGEIVDPPATPARPLPAAPERPAIEGAASMAVEITGVASGAAEAQAIASAVRMANETYIANLANIRRRIAIAIEATLANVEMQGGGAVVTALGRAAEAAAQAQAAASTCGSEVGPLMAIAANEFNKRS